MAPLNMGSITKNDKTTIMRDKYLDILGKSREKNFSHHFVCLHPMRPYASCVKYIYLPILPKWQHFKMKLTNFKTFSSFLKTSHFSSNIHFLSREAIKTRWDRAFWNRIPKKVRFLVHKSDSTITPARYISCSRVYRLRFMYKICRFLSVKF